LVKTPVTSRQIHPSNQSVDGIKTFNSSPIVPTLLSADNSNKAVSTCYVDTAIANLISGAPSTMDTLSEIANILQTDTNNITAITNNMVDISSNQTIIGTKTFSVSPIVPTQAQGKNSTNVATTALQQHQHHQHINQSHPCHHIRH
jgi:hypothetical protein